MMERHKCGIGEDGHGVMEGWDLIMGKSNVSRHLRN